MTVALNLQKGACSRSISGETDATIVVEAELPGIDKDNLEVSLDRNMLTMTGRLASFPKTLKPIWKEISDNPYQRTLILDNSFYHNKINALLKNGILTLTLQKTKASLPQKITVT